MAVVNPPVIRGIDLTAFPALFASFPDTQPFSQRAGQSWMEQYEAIIAFLKGPLNDHLADLDGYNDDVLEALAAALTAQNLSVGTQLQTILAQIIAGQNVTLNDGTINAAVQSLNSATFAYLKTQFASKTRDSEHWFNVMDFGAVGDGNANDTAAVQAAVTAALAASDPINVEQPRYVGKSPTVFFPLGTYNVDQITIPGTIVMKGVGGAIYASSTIQQRAAGQNIFFLTADTDGQSNACVFEDLTFKSRSGTSNPNVAQIKTDPNTVFTSSVYYRNCWFKTPEAYAIWQVRGGDVQIDGCTFDVSAFHAIKLGDNSNTARQVSAVRITHNTFFNITVRAIEVSNAQDVLISDNSYENGPGFNNSIFLQVTGGGLCTRVDAKNNQVSGVNMFTEIDATTDMSMIGIDGNTAHVNYGFVHVAGGAVLYALSCHDNKVQSDNALPHGAIWADSTGMSVSDFSHNIVLPGATSPLLIDMSDGRVAGNTFKDNTSIRITTPHNLSQAGQNSL